MIPILYEKNEVSFTSNGLGRLRDCISCIVTEERNGIYECDFEYPMTGAYYDLIQVGRIIGVTHDDGDDIQPFDIVSFEKPIEGVVTFHCTHISYRQSYLTITGTNIQSLSAAFALLANAEPANTFNYWTDKSSTGYLGCMNGIPRSVRQVLGGVEGSILDIYGGEYEWDMWTVKLWAARGQQRDFAIRYGVNMLDYNEELDSSSCYSSCVPYWTDGTNTIVGDKQTGTGITPSGRDQCIALDVSGNFESQPTKAQVEAIGASAISSKSTTTPAQNITVSFIRLQDLDEFADYESLLQCKLCDTIKVIFPDYNSSGNFKIVKTIWNVLTDKYEQMELGDLSITLAEALGGGIGSGGSYSGGGGTTDYTDLDNKPQINNVTLTGNKTSSQIGVADAVHTHTVSQITDFPTLATVATSGNYNDLSNKPSIPTITDTYDGTSSNGMSGKAVKSAIDALDGTISGSPGAGKTLTAFSQTDGKVSATFGNISITKSQVSDFPTLATVATSGDYDDLIDKPTLSAVATSGDYDDLINKPTIPTVNDATLTIQKNGTDVQTFTANASSDVTANITVPVKVSDLNNDSGFITSPNIPYCTCATAAGTKAKTTTIVSGTFTADDLVTGAQVLVKFTYSNTVADPTLKIGSTTAKTIKRYGTTAPSTSAASSWNANSVIMFTYDGTYWQMTDYNNTTYSSMTVAEYEAGTGTTARTITPARLKGAIQYWDAVTSVNSKTGAVTLTAFDVGALADTTTYVSSFNGSTGAVTYTAPVASVNSKTGAVTLTASDVGALPDTTTIPSKLSDLTNDLIYDLGTVTVSGGAFSVSNDDVTAITALWSAGFCALKLTVNSKDYYAFKERTVTYGGYSFMGFVAAEGDINGLNQPTTGTTIVGINSSGIGMFAVIKDLDHDDIQTEVSSAVAGKQDTLVSGTNIKTINNQSILGSGDLSITVTSTKNIWYATCTTADTTNAKVVATSAADFILATGNMVRVYFSNAAGQSAITLNVDGTGAISAYYHGSGNAPVNREGWAAGEVIDFVYDGTRYLMVDGSPASATHWGKTLLESSVSSTSTAMAATPSAVKTAYDLADAANTLAGNALPKTGGEVTGNVTLKAGAGQNSPSLIFQRGTLTDNYNDWQIYDKSGFLYFGQRGQNSTAFADQVYFNTTGGVYATTFNGSGANLTGVVTSVNGSSGAITGVQTTGNLVTSVTSASTDSEYPSAKLLYDLTRKSVVQATGSTSSTSLTNGTITQIPLTTYIASDETNATWNDTQKGIEVLTAGYYKIQGSVYFKSTGTSISAIGAYIKVAANGGAFSTASEVLGGYTATGKISNDYVSTTPAKLVYLNANDIVYLCGRVSGANGTVQPDNRATFLLVEQV